MTTIQSKGHDSISGHIVLILFPPRSCTGVILGKFADFLPMFCDRVAIILARLSNFKIPVILVLFSSSAINKIFLISHFLEKRHAFLNFSVEFWFIFPKTVRMTGLIVVVGQEAHVRLK